MSKSISVGLVAIALDNGKLRRTDRIRDILPELAKSGLGDATVDDVLNMASGLKNFVGPAWTFDGMVDFAMKRLKVASGFLECSNMDPAVDSWDVSVFIATTEKTTDMGSASTIRTSTHELSSPLLKAS